MTHGRNRKEDEVMKKDDGFNALHAGHQPTSDLVRLLTRRAPRIALAIAAFQTVQPLYYRGKSYLEDRVSYTISIRSGDEVYEAAHEWVLSLLPSAKQRSLIAYTARKSRGGKWVNEIALQYDSRQDSIVRYAGHVIRVSVNEGRFETENSEGGSFKPPELQLTVQSATARDAVATKLNDLIQSLDRADRPPTVKMYGEWGWETISDAPPRPLESVILPPGQMNQIITDMQRFIDAEDAYVRRGIPYHRGYLFTGPPRTGKTSVARAIASHFNMDLWYLPLGDVRRDGDLLKRVTQLPPRAILLLEDVDVFHAATMRDEEDGGRATLAGLLNATDGAGTPHGLITIMTSNAPEKLDSALIQPGRVDLIECFRLCTAEQASDIIKYYYDDELVPVSTGLDGVSPAEVVEACKRHDKWEDVVSYLLENTPVHGENILT